MKLPREFCRLPLRFDAQRLADEVRALPADAWREHPTSYPGNRAVRLISGGGGENDDLGGVMAPTPHLARLPYVRQVLASFGVVWSRSRLMLLAPGTQVPPHCDINYHWFHRVRVHIPVITFPEVTFFCGDAQVHMAAGEAWIFDNWRPHKVLNPTSQARIHLVADTIGNAAFWEMARRGQWENHRTGNAPLSPLLAFDAGAQRELLTERVNTPIVMPPSEVASLLGELAQDLAAEGNDAAGRRALAAFRVLLDGFVRQWRHLWALHGEAETGWPLYLALRDHLRRELQAHAGRVWMRSNRVDAMQVVDARVLRHVINPPGAEAFRKRHVA